MNDPCLYTIQVSLSSKLRACFGRRLKGFLVIDLYPNTLVWVAERRKWVTREPYKRGFLFETLEPAGGNAGGISSLWYGTHHHRCFPYRPNSMCLSAAFFVWDRLAGVHCSSVPPGHICRHVDGRSDGKGHLPTLPGNIRRKKWGSRSWRPIRGVGLLLPPSFWSGLSSKRLRLFWLSSALFDIGVSVEKRGGRPLMCGFNYVKATSIDWLSYLWCCWTRLELRWQICRFEPW